MTDEQGYVKLIHTTFEALADEMVDAEALREAWRSVVLLPRAEYDALLAEREKLRRALWKLLEHGWYVASRQTETVDGVTRKYMSSFESYDLLFCDLGLLIPAPHKGERWYEWTHAAHELAKGRA